MSPQTTPLVGSSPCSSTSRTYKIKTKIENTTKQQAMTYTMSLRGSTMCLHPREMATHHHHIDHETLQVQYKQQLA